MSGKVVFDGAGPGAADLITLRGARVIAEADIIIWASSLVSPDLVAGHKRGAELIDSASASLEDLTPLYERARDEGLLVARVHTGDPAIYGATAEQRDQCRAVGIAFESIPGVSAFSAAAAAAEVELTLPEVAQSLILTRLEGVGGRAGAQAGQDQVVQQCLRVARIEPLREGGAELRPLHTQRMCARFSTSSAGTVSGIATPSSRAIRSETL